MERPGCSLATSLAQEELCGGWSGGCGTDCVDCGTGGCGTGWKDFGGCCTSCCSCSSSCDELRGPVVAVRELLSLAMNNCNSPDDEEEVASEPKVHLEPRTERPGRTKTETGGRSKMCNGVLGSEPGKRAYLAQRILLAGDIESNPGPRYICPICHEKKQE